jgi:hypothetical protein
VGSSAWANSAGQPIAGTLLEAWILQAPLGSPVIVAARLSAAAQANP